MNSTNQFQVYNASAGSGKTFTLVKEYLKILLRTDDLFRFQNILAITFTNKAAAEMKSRILESLKDLSDGKEEGMGSIILDELDISKEKLQHRSNRILNNILQNYSGFTITTIDSFTHRIIRSFAFDLGLSMNFEVEMDAVSLLDEAVDVLISKIGSNEELTQTLIDFSLEKADDDKSWDIAHDLKEFARILLNENDVLEVKKIASKNIEDFTLLKKQLKKEQKKIECQFKSIGEEAIEIIESNNLEKGVYTRNTFPNHFKNLAQDFKKAKFFDETTLKSNVENEKIYNKGAVDYQSILDEVQPVLEDLYYQSEKLFQKYTLNGLVLKSLIPLAVLKHINAALEDIKNQNNIRLNAEFNKIISDQIKNEPAPFIYERIGEKFRYYFIDEMQDTSGLQWNNLIPLIENSLSSETLDNELGELMLVGDVKQAIYRWRGGKAEQFANLANQDFQSFYIDKEVKNLDTTYRSCEQIIEFNNHFFSHVSNFLENDLYKDLYVSGNNQKTNSKIGGYVQIDFEEITPQDKDVVFSSKVHEIIKNLDTSFKLGDVCVLVRTKNQGIAVANYLTELKVPIISSETLLLSKNVLVDFIINLLTVIHTPNQKKSTANILYFLHKKLNLEKDTHAFAQENVHKINEELFTGLSEYGVHFIEQEFEQLPLYESVEYLISSFNLIQNSDAFVQAFLDEVLNFQNKRGSSLGAFLEFWELKKEKLSISIPEGQNAVQIMTIHKSKGLEFPIVIYPYDLEIYREVKPKVWYSNLSDEDFLNFNTSLVDYSKKLKYTGELGSELFVERQKELQLDNLNLLYVAMTRPVEQLYIITEKKKKSNELTSAKYYSDLFVDFLNTEDYSEEKTTYNFGSSKRSLVDAVEVNRFNKINQEKFISSNWKNQNIRIASNSLVLWNDTIKESIDYGNLIHEMLADIHTVDDIEYLVAKSVNKGVINALESQQIKEQLSKVLMHPDLCEYFQPNNHSINEQEIVDENGYIHIPDKVIVIGNSVTIIDYKTGEQDKSHKNQLNRYASVFENMGYKISKLLLVYLENKIAIIEVSKI